MLLNTCAGTGEEEDSRNGPVDVNAVLLNAAITPPPIAGLLTAVAGEEALPALRDACAVDVKKEFWNRPLLQNRTVEEEGVVGLGSKQFRVDFRSGQA